MKKIILIALFSLFSGFMSAAVGEDVKKANNHYIGMEASSMSGVGISYGYRFHPDYMFKFCGFYYESSYKETNPSNPAEKDYNRDIWWNGGAEIQMNFFSLPVSKSTLDGYGLIGGMFMQSRDINPYYPEEDSKSSSWVTGIGFGLRLVLVEHLAFNIDLGYQFKQDIEDEERKVGFGGAIGAHFLF